MKSFHLGVICPQNPKLGGGQKAPHSQQATGQGMDCREILFTPYCSPRDRELPRPGQLFCTTYGSRATGRQNCPIFGFWPIFPLHTKREMGARKCPGRRGYFVSNTRRLFGNFATADFRQIWLRYVNRG